VVQILIPLMHALVTTLSLGLRAVIFDKLLVGRVIANRVSLVLAK